MAVILIVEDEFFIRAVAVGMIESWGHQTLVADDVEEALVLLRSPARIDALFTDMRLKQARFGGCEIATEAVALRPGLPVLYTTAFDASDELRSRFVDGGHFLAKPYSPSDLQASVERLLAGSVLVAA